MTHPPDHAPSPARPRAPRLNMPGGPSGPGPKMPRPREPRRPRSKALRWLIWAAIAGLGALLLAGGAGLLLLMHYTRDLPTVETLLDYRPPQATRITDREGRLIQTFAKEQRTVVPMSRIPRVLVLSMLAAEDADFYRHEGMDYRGIARALWRDVVTGKPVQGASTITQQIVKNVLLTPERTIRRKVRELVLARRVEQELSKEQILYLYLNHIYFGHGRYGVQEAARFYFDKDVEDISLAEASLIAGLPQAPARLSPLRHPRAARRRQLYVLRQLEQKRDEYWPDLTVEQIEAARENEVTLAEHVDDGFDAAPEIVTLARQALRDQVGEEAAEHGGYTVQTTIDLALQTQARKALREGLQGIDERQGYRGPLRKPRRRKPLPEVKALHVGGTYDARVTGTDDAERVLELDVGGRPGIVHMDEVERFNPEGLPPSEFAAIGARVRASVLRMGESTDEPARMRLELGPQGALIVLDPDTREVLALVGAYEEDYGFNRAVQAARQPGSTFKPIVYAAALQARKYTPASLVLDAPEVFDEWKPQNYDTWNHQGAVRLREALAKSINLVAVRVIQDITPERVIELSRDLGITTPLEDTPALALGASEVHPIELTNAYASFAARGRWEPTRVVKSIATPDGETLELDDDREPARDVLTPAEAYMVTSMLQSVIQGGTGARAQALGRPAAGKTGTSNESRDAWFMGYTPQTVAGVWVGFDDRRPLGRGESGSHAALPIWLQIMKAAEADEEPADFVMPSDVVTAEIDPKTGLLAYEGMEETMQEVFLVGTVPTETAPSPDVLDSNRFMMEQIGALAAPVDAGTPSPELGP